MRICDWSSDVCSSDLDRDWLQFDCALSYGLVEYLRTLDVMQELGWSSRRVVPHGGHQMSLNIAAGLHLGGNESYPDVFKPFGGVADGIAVVDSYVRLPKSPGIGFEQKAELYAVMKENGRANGGKTVTNAHLVVRSMLEKKKKKKKERKRNE